MEFNEFKKEFQKQFDTLTKNKDKLYLTDIPKYDLWEKYLNSFPGSIS